MDGRAPAASSKSVKHNQFTYLNSNLAIAPDGVQQKINQQHHAGEQFTLGDLHGNVLKLLHFLLQQGLITLPKGNYEKIHDNYMQWERIGYQDSQTLNGLLNEFENLIKKIEFTAVNNLIPPPLVRLIGDEMADRGYCDYLTLLLLKKIEEKIPIEMTISNHSMEFIQSYETLAADSNKAATDIFRDTLSEGQSRSMAALGVMIKNKVITTQEVIDLTDAYYKPSLKALSYTLSPNQKEISIFSHAGIGLSTIKAMTERLTALGHSCKYKAGSAREIAATIDRINAIFQKEFVEKNNVDKLIIKHPENIIIPLADEDIWFDGVGRNINPTFNPFLFLIWNRNYDLLDKERPEALPNGDKCNWGHGHDDQDTMEKKHIQSLDSAFGKHKNYFSTGSKYGNPIVTTIGTSQVLSLSPHQVTKNQAIATRIEPEKAKAINISSVSIEVKYSAPSSEKADPLYDSFLRDNAFDIKRKAEEIANMISTAYPDKQQSPKHKHAKLLDWMKKSEPKVALLEDKAKIFRDTAFDNLTKFCEFIDNAKQSANRQTALVLTEHVWDKATNRLEKQQTPITLSTDEKETSQLLAELTAKFIATVDVQKLPPSINYTIKQNYLPPIRELPFDESIYTQEVNRIKQVIDNPSSALTPSLKKQ